jgi:hypothetical protein
VSAQLAALAEDLAGSAQDWIWRCGIVRLRATRSATRLGPAGGPVKVTPPPHVEAGGGRESSLPLAAVTRTDEAVISPGAAETTWSAPETPVSGAALVKVTDG